MTATIQRTVSKAAWVEAELRASEARLRLVQKVRRSFRDLHTSTWVGRQELTATAIGAAERRRG
jgi:hypothetical protein